MWPVQEPDLSALSQILSLTPVVFYQSDFPTEVFSNHQSPHFSVLTKQRLPCAPCYTLAGHMPQVFSYVPYVLPPGIKADSNYYCLSDLMPSLTKVVHIGNFLNPESYQFKTSTFKNITHLCYNSF